MNGLRLRSIPILLVFFLYRAVILSQPAGYYSSAEGKTGMVLQQALHDIIDNHTELTYGDLWAAFQTTDKKSDGTVWDMYSDIPGGTPAYVYQFITDQCGNYSKEGDCYNREHSFPKSWFNDLAPMYTDLFHLYPTDGWVNNKRGNYPFGVTATPVWTSTNGSKVGPSSYPGYTGTVFEPVSSYKGDFARSYFYMAVRYYGEDAAWPQDGEMFTGSQPKEWALRILMDWHVNDPVSQKETDRNESVYLLQGNRNPFIDNPDYALLIWGSPNHTGNVLAISDPIKIYPNPADDFLTIEFHGKNNNEVLITVADISGRILYNAWHHEQKARIDTRELKEGIYILYIDTGSKIFYRRLVLSR